MDYYDYGLCWGLYQTDVKVTLHTCDETKEPSRAPFLIKRDYKNIYGEDPPWRRGIRYVLGSVRALLDSVYSGAKICHFHFFHVGPLEMINICLAKLLRRSVVITSHDVEPFASGLSVPLFVTLAYRLADKVIAHNRFSIDTFGRHADPEWVRLCDRLIVS